MGEGIWGIEVCVVVNADAEPVNQLASQPAADSAHDNSRKREEARRLWRVDDVMAAHDPTDEEEGDRRNHRAGVKKANTLRARARGNGNPVDQAEDGGDQAADDAQGDQVIRGLGPPGPAPSEIEDVKN